MPKELPADRWISYIDRSCHFKTHTISSRIAGSFIANMMSRGMEPDDNGQPSLGEFETNGGFGSIITQYPKLDFQLGDKILRLKTNLVAETGLSLVTLKEKMLPTGEKYHVLYSRMHVLVLTSEETKLLLPQLAVKLVEARETSQSFMSMFNKSWSRGIKEYKEEHGTDLPYEFVPVAKDNA
jgi:hypothetical protein